MPDKLTDKDIVKALGCCLQVCEDCNSCPAVTSEHTTVWECKDALSKQVLDLINRLQEENERLKNAYKQCAWERDIFAEDIKEEIKKDCSYLMLDIKTIKAEAYKECIEKVKEKSQVEIYCDNQLPEPIATYHITEDTLDNLLKEMIKE